jgi:hypothetical protein
MKPFLTSVTAAAILSLPLIAASTSADARTVRHHHAYAAPAQDYAYAPQARSFYGVPVNTPWRPYSPGESYGSGGGWRTRLNHRPWNEEQATFFDRQMQGIHE